MTADVASPPLDLTADALYLTADDPPEDPELAELATHALADPAGPDDPDGPDAEAPYGWTTDRETGERRPKKRAGRPKHPPAADELRQGEPAERPEDKAPAAPGRGSRRRGKVAATEPGKPPAGAAAAADEVPMPAGGHIARQVNKLYRRGGKLIRGLNWQIGQAFIECTRKDTLEDGSPDPDDVTVGEAWETICKENPRIRAFVVKAIAGGNWTDLVLAHAPIGIAIMGLPAIEKRLPRFIASMLEPDEDTQDGDLTESDVADFMSMSDETLDRIADKAARMMDEPGAVPEDMRARAQAAADRARSRIAAGLSTGNDPDLPPQFRRVQPKHSSRAKRRR